jgi:hypothetical protein
MIKRSWRRPQLIAKFYFVWSASSHILRTEQISRLKQFSDIFILMLLRQLGPKLYYEARLWRPNLVWTDKLGFMTQKRYNKRIAELNPPSYQKLSQHKQAEKALFRLLNIPSPEYIGFYHNNNGSTEGGSLLLDDNQLVLLLRNYNNQKLCFKPAEGYGGAGFIAAEVIVDKDTVQLKRLNADNYESVKTFSEHYLSNPRGYIIEKYFSQHPILAELNPSSVNTIRIWVRQQGANVTVLGAVLRLGRKDSLVDNSAEGGILAYLDSEQGKLGLGRTTDIFSALFEYHPDSNAKISGRQLPHWPACIELAKRTLRSFPMASFAGLDLAIGHDGPVIIEMNLNPDKVSARIFDKSHNELLS